MLDLLDGIDPLTDAVSDTPPPAASAGLSLTDECVAATLRDLHALLSRSESSHAIYPTGIQSIDDWTSGGLQPGKLILLAAFPNFGKTAILQTITRGLMELNDDVIVMALSLDDTVGDYISRYLAGEGHLPIWAVQQGANRRAHDAARGTEYESRLSRAVTRFETFTAKRMLVRGKRDVTQYGKGALSTLELIEQLICETYISVRTRSGRRPQLVVTVDSPRNIKIKEGGLAANPTALVEYIGSSIKEMLDLSVDIDGARERIEPIIITTEHIKKLPKEQKRPGMDDIKDSITLQYHADLVMMLWNDACYRARVLKTQDPSDMVFARPDLPDKRNGGRPSLDPVVELTLAKNKMGRMQYSGASSTDLFKFYQDQSRMEEITERVEFDTYACYLEG